MGEFFKRDTLRDAEQPYFDKFDPVQIGGLSATLADWMDSADDLNPILDQIVGALGLIDDPVVPWLDNFKLSARMQLIDMQRGVHEPKRALAMIALMADGAKPIVPEEAPAAPE